MYGIYDWSLKSAKNGQNSVLCESLTSAVLGIPCGAAMKRCILAKAPLFFTLPGTLAYSLLVVLSLSIRELSSLCFAERARASMVSQAPKGEGSSASFLLLQLRTERTVHTVPDDYVASNKTERLSV